MRPRKQLLFLLLSSIATAGTSPAAADNDLSSGNVATRSDTGTRAAVPVDGKDGKPHHGPFVDTDRKREPTSAESDTEFPVLKGRPDDPTIVDGKKIPESNDGVMDDKARSPPKQGTTGTEGGVSEKEKQIKEWEGRTGEKAEKKPEAPKEAPRILSQDDVTKQREDSDSRGDLKDTDVSGLEKPKDLPSKIHDDSPPVPDSAVKDHLKVPSKKISDSNLSSDEDVEGLIQPFHSFVLSLTMILVSEIGDKTFLVAALMAMKHDRMVVFSAAFSALLVMTVLSAVLGHAVPTLIPKRLTNFAAAALFFVFGAKLLREGMEMSPDEDVSAELHEVEQELAEKEKEAFRNNGAELPLDSLEMGLPESRKSRSRSRFPTPPRSPSTSPSRLPKRPKGVSDVTQGLNNLFGLLLSPAWVQTFVMTFLGEWGDRSQIATIAMAAGQDYWWVTLGAMLGHAVCTSVAVIGGRAIAGRVSLKKVTMGGAIAFLIFAFIYLFEGFYG